MEQWLATSWEALALVGVTTVSIYLVMVALTRISGLRSFSKISSFDFAVTVAIGSLLATTILSPDPPLLRAAGALAFLYAIQIGVAVLRTRSSRIRALVDNAPLLLMDHGEVMPENLAKAQLTEADLRGKLREANVLRYDEVRAAVMESTGDVSVLHGPPDGAELDDRLLEDVRRHGGQERELS